MNTMYKINSNWNKFVLGVINNIGWIIVIILSTMTLLFTQLGTWHEETGTIHQIIDSYEEYGKIHHIEILNIDLVPLENKTTVADYYTDLKNEISDKIQAIEVQLYDYTKYPLNSPSRLIKEKELEGYQSSLDRLNDEIQLIIDGKLQGIEEFSIIAKSDQKFNWVGEYTYNKIFYLATTDFYSWMMALMLAISAIVIKVQGNRTGKNSGLKMVWKTTLRHATLSEKIAPKAKEAELVCQEMNSEELRLQRETKLRYVALKYSDVFDEDGTFLPNPNFVQVETKIYKDSKGNTKYKVNEYQANLLKKQKKMIEHLKKFKIKEVHTYILLESKAESKERFDFGESLKSRDRRVVISNIVTSFATMLPMFGAVSLFVITENGSNLLLGIIGMIINFVALLFNMFSAYDYIINVWAPGVLKKSDTLLVIGNRLNLTDEKDNNWEATIEKELLAENKN